MAIPKTSLLRLAVVGHTNTGKTSLLRTLARDPDFGDVRDSPGTTRHVEGLRLLVEGQAMIELFDTPGIEDSIGLVDYFEQLATRGERLDGPDRILRFLDSPESGRRFEQEARVLRTMLDCDAGLYVVDVRDPVLGKHKDELAILAGCGKPLLPVLNFTHDRAAQARGWREALARLGLHVSVEFNTVAPALDGEAQLYDRLALLTEQHAAVLHALKLDIARQRQIRGADAARLVAELLVDVAAWRISSATDEPSLKSSIAMLREKTRMRETACVSALLKRYNFNARDFPAHSLPLEGERWGMDLFHPQALKEVGIHVGKGMAAGAMAGATIDLFTAGLSLGAAAMIGAAAGGVWQSADRLGKRVMGRLQGHHEISVDDHVLCLLGLRQLALIQALERRGHAAQGPITLAAEIPAQEADEPPDVVAALRKGKLPPELKEARSQPQWSALANDFAANARREAITRSLTDKLLLARRYDMAYNTTG